MTLRPFIFILAFGWGFIPGPVSAADIPPGAKTPLPPPAFTVHKERSDLTRKARPASGFYDGPVVDTHVHVMNRELGGLHSIPAKMDKSHVEKLILLPTPNEGIFRDNVENAQDRRQFLKLVGDRGGRLCGSTYFTNWMGGAYKNGYAQEELTQRLKRLRDDLESGTCAGIGEIGPYHFQKKPNQHIVEFPLNFRPMMAVAALAAEKDVWLDLHTEPVSHDGRSVEDALYGGIALLFQRSPNLKLILAHTAMTNPTNVRALFETYPNLMVNLKMVRPGGGLLWDQLEPISNVDDELFEDWAKLMEDWPDRFMIGTDSRFGTIQYTEKKFGKGIAKIRRVLSSLDRSVADRIAHANARRVFGETSYRFSEKLTDPRADTATEKPRKKKRRRGRRRNR